MKFFMIGDLHLGKDNSLEYAKSQLVDLCGKIRAESYPKEMPLFIIMGDIIHVSNTTVFEDTKVCLDCIRKELAENKSFWDEIFLYIEKAYDIGQIEKVYINGDGENRMEGGKHRLPKIITTLDEFYLQKYLLKMVNHILDSKSDVIGELTQI